MTYNLRSYEDITADMEDCLRGLKSLRKIDGLDMIEYKTATRSLQQQLEVVAAEWVACYRWHHPRPQPCKGCGSRKWIQKQSTAKGSEICSECKMGRRIWPD